MAPNGSCRPIGHPTSENGLKPYFDAYWSQRTCRRVPGKKMADFDGKRYKWHTHTWNYVETVEIGS